MRHVRGVAEMLANSGVAGVSGMATVHWAGVKPRRFSEGCTEPDSPNGEDGAEPGRAVHDPIIHPPPSRFQPPERRSHANRWYPFARYTRIEPIQLAAKSAITI